MDRENKIFNMRGELAMKDKILGGIIGLCVADALGVPVEFESRASLERNPVVDMRGYGTHNQPPGTWSDDSSLTLASMDSLTGGLVYADVMRKFLSWVDDGEFTPYGEVFDIGHATRKALQRFANGVEPLMCGGASEYENGNGALMRILPLVFYLHALYKPALTESDEAFDVIHNISSLTHAHKRSRIACGIYISVAEGLLCDKKLRHAVLDGLQTAKRYYGNKSEYVEELKHFERVFDCVNMPREAIASSGYVVHTLEAAIWCLLNTDSYESCVLKAVNLGEDTDTVASVAGGLAGMGYGIDAIPEKWVSQIARLDYIKGLCMDFHDSIVSAA